MALKIIKNARKDLMSLFMKEIKPFFRKSKLIDTIEFGVGCGSFGFYGLHSEILIINGEDAEFYADKIKTLNEGKKKNEYTKVLGMYWLIKDALEGIDKKIEHIEEAFVMLFGNCWITIERDGKWTFKQWM